MTDTTFIKTVLSLGMALLLSNEVTHAAVLEGLAPINAAGGGELGMKPQWDRSYDSQTVDNLMLKAREFYDAGNLLEALRLIRDAKRRLPLSTNIKLTLSHVYIELGRYESGLDEIYSLLDAEPKNPGYLRMSGYCLEKLGKYEEALQLYERFSRVARTSEKPQFYIGAVLFKLDRIDEAIDAYEKAVDINPENAETHEALGAAWHQVERYDEAIAQFKKAIALDPEYAPAYNSLGTTYFADEKHEQGMEYVKRAIQVDPRFSPAYSNLGSMHARLQDTRTAVELYSAAIDLDPYNSDAWRNLFLAIDDQMPKTKDSEFEAAPDSIEDPVKRAHWHYLESARFKKKDDTYTSARHLMAAIQSNTDVPAYFNDLGVILGRTTFPRLAVHFYNMALIMNPNYELAQKNLNEHINMLDEVAKNRMERGLIEQVTANPESSLARYQLGNFYAVQGAMSNALPHMISAAGLAPDNVLPRLGLTRVLYASGQLESALETLLSCFEISPKSLEAWQQLFLALHLMIPTLPDGELLPEPDEELEPAALAAWHYRQAVQQDATDTNKWVYAARHMHMATITDPTIPEYYDDYGALLEQGINPRLAVPFYQKAALMDEKNPTFAQHLEAARIAADEYRFRTHRDARLAAIKAEPENPQHHVNMAIFLAENQKVEESIPYLERALSLDPNHQTALFTIARARHSLKDVPGAIKAMDQLIRLQPENMLLRFRKAYLISEIERPPTPQIKMGLQIMEAVLESAKEDTPPNLYRVSARLFAHNKEYEKAVRHAVAAAKAAQKVEDEDLAKEILAEAKQHKTLADQSR